MKINSQSDIPIFVQIAAGIEDAVLTGTYPEESQIPSTTEISAMLKINPATVLKGMNLLVDENVIYKKRGLGMFVSSGAMEKIKEKRREKFGTVYVKTLISEARKLGMNQQEIISLIEEEYENEKN